jgi:cytochrome c2
MTMRLRRNQLALLGVLLLGATGAAATAGVRQYSLYQSEAVARALTAGEPSRAPEMIRRYGCSGCHTIPGIPGADGQVGTSLSDIRHRVYVGGVAFNSPENLVRWIVSPQSFSEHSAMPATGISEAEARDVAAYLYAR